MMSTAAPDPAAATAGPTWTHREAAQATAVVAAQLERHAGVLGARAGCPRRRPHLDKVTETL